MPASPPLSKRGKILNNLIRQLQTITPDNGYAQNVVEVTSNVKGWLDKVGAETPVLYIVDDNTVYTYHAGRLTEREWNVSIIGHMRDRLQTDMEELISDIETCLFKNVTLNFPETGATCSHLRITNIITDNQLFSEVEGSQLFRVNIVIRYTSPVDNVR